MAAPALVGLMSAGGAAATGASVGSALMVGGSLASAAGQIAGGMAEDQAQRAHQAELQREAEIELMLGGVEDQRTREAFKRSMAEMRLGLAGRGVELSSPSALALADDAAREMTAASQDVRSRSAARADELTAEGRRARAVGSNAVMRGTLGAASSVLTAAPDLWPGLADRKLRA
ncbi:MAG: hypothetical protein AAF192_21570 [Pseudomonadota bacterium]